jgi:hypothetical protein
LLRFIHYFLPVLQLPQNQTIRTLLKRLENTVHALCLLADTIQSEAQAGRQANQAETNAITLGQKTIRELVNLIHATFSPQ